MRRGVGALFVAFLAARVLLGPVSTSAPSKSSAKPASVPKKPAAINPPKLAVAKTAQAPREQAPCEASSEKCPAKGLVGAVDASLATPKSTRLYLSSLPGVSDEMKDAHFFIATVPDPAHTHLSLLFDRQVAAIEQAVQQAGYLFTRAYLPWDNLQHQEDTDYRIRLGQQDYQDAREEFPGLLLFRDVKKSGDDTNTRSLLVFLVGETPTGGINKLQFSNAMAAIQDLCSKGCDDVPLKGGTKTLFILGPMFSGSLYSLQALVSEANASPFQFTSIDISSGTATDHDTVQWFVDKEGQNVKFQSFQMNSADALQDVLGFACSQNYQADEIAVLSEDETAYGNAPPPPGPDPTVNGNASPNTTQSSSKTETAEPATDSIADSSEKIVCSTQKSRGKDRVLHLNFPRDFSALRNAYQRDLETTSSSSSSAPRSTLRLNLEDQGNDDDSVPSFSPAQTPLSEEAILMGIVSKLRERKINLVVIEATNPLDIVFMVRYLRDAYPDARIVTLNSDLLLPRQVNEPHLRGVMQIVTYPLVGDVGDSNLDLCGQIPQVFPNDDSEGTFLAALSLMKTQKSAYGCLGFPGLPSVTLPYAVDRLWLTVLGRDQFWPIAAYHDVANLNPDPGQPPDWIILCASAIAFALVYALIAFKGTIVSSSIFMANFAPVKDHWRNRTLLFCGLLIFDVFFCVLWPRFWEPACRRFLFFPALLCVAGLVLVDLFRRNKWAPDRGLLILGAVGFAVSFVVLYEAFRFENGRLPWIFQRYRYENVLSGVSPVVPYLLLFAGFLWTCWHSLSGRPPWDCDGSGPPLPSHDQVVAGDNVDSKQRLEGLTCDRNKDLLRLMRTGSVQGRLVILTGIILAIPLLTLTVLATPHTVQSFESFGYNVIYSVLLVLAIALVVWDTVRLSFIWLELRVLLMVLDRLPLRRGFVRMAGFKSRRLWQLGGNTFEDFFAVMSMEIQTISALHNLDSLDAESMKALTDAQNTVSGLAKWMREQHEQNKQNPPKPGGAEFTQDLVSKLQDMQKTLAGTCAAILQYLRNEWDGETRHAWDAECMARAKDDYKDDVDPPVQLAEDFASLFYFNFICSVFTRMRALVLAIVGMYVFILLSFSSYPFEPNSTFHLAMSFLLVFITAAVAIVFAQAHKDATVSRITDRDAGKLGFDFWFRLVGVMGVPILSLLAAKFPEIGGFLFSWLEPASQAFK
jgi:ABC-type multidrug transport system fused ATPase/permease subunit